MADLTLTAGPITSTIAASNDRAQRVIEGNMVYIGLDPGAMSNQQMADVFMAEIKAFVLRRSKAAEVLAGRAASDAEVEEDPPEWEE